MGLVEDAAARLEAEEKAPAGGGGSLLDQAAAIVEAERTPPPPPTFFQRLKQRAVQAVTPAPSPPTPAPDLAGTSTMLGGPEAAPAPAPSAGGVELTGPRIGLGEDVTALATPPPAATAPQVPSQEDMRNRTPGIAVPGVTQRPEQTGMLPADVKIPGGLRRTRRSPLPQLPQPTTASEVVERMTPPAPPVAPQPGQVALSGPLTEATAPAVLEQTAREVERRQATGAVPPGAAPLPEATEAETALPMRTPSGAAILGAPVAGVEPHEPSLRVQEQPIEPGPGLNRPETAPRALTPPGRRLGSPNVLEEPSLRKFAERKVEAAGRGLNRSIEGLLYSALPGGESLYDESPAFQPDLLDKAIEGAVSLSSPLSLVTFALGSGLGYGGAQAVLRSLVRVAGPEAVLPAIRLATEALGRNVGAFGAYDAASELLRQSAAVQRGEQAGPELGAAARRIGHGLLTGAAIAPAAFLSPLLRAGWEVSVFATLPPVLEGRAPTADDVIDAGVLIGTLRAAHKLSDVVRAAMAKPAAERTPEEQATVAAVPPATKRAVAEEALGEAQRLWSDAQRRAFVEGAREELGQKIDAYLEAHPEVAADLRRSVEAPPATPNVPTGSPSLPSPPAAPPESPAAPAPTPPRATLPAEVAPPPARPTGAAGFFLAIDRTEWRDLDRVAGQIAASDLPEAERERLYGLIAAKREAGQRAAAAVEPAPAPATTPTSAPPSEGRPAPAVFAFWQPALAGRPPMPMYHLTADIPGHPEGSTVSAGTLTSEGYTGLPDALPAPRTPEEWEAHFADARANRQASQPGLAAPRPAPSAAPEPGPRTSPPPPAPIAPPAPPVGGARQEVPPAFALPRDLAGAKPRYNLGERSYELQFASDLDKALYIVAQLKPSARDADYLAAIRRAAPGLSDAELRQQGRHVRSFVRTQVEDAEPGPVQIPVSPIGDEVLRLGRGGGPTVSTTAAPPPVAAGRPVDLEPLAPAMRAAEVQSRKDGMVVTFRGETWTYAAAQDLWRAANGDTLGTKQLVSHLRTLESATPATPAGAASARPRPTAAASEGAFNPRDIDQLVAFVRSQGGLAPSPTGDLAGEYARVPFQFKSRRGLSPAAMAEAVKEASGVDLADHELLGRLANVRQLRAQKGQVGEASTAEEEAAQAAGQLTDDDLIRELADRMQVSPEEARSLLERQRRATAFAPGEPTEDERAWALDLVDHVGGLAEAKAAVARLGAEQTAETPGGRVLSKADQQRILEALTPGEVEAAPPAAAPAPTGPEVTREARAEATAPAEVSRPGYANADRLRRLTDAFTQAIEAKTLPRDPRDLRALAARALGADEAIFREPAAIDDLYDALEAAVNRRYRAGRDDRADLSTQVTRARAAEDYLGNRTRTLELAQRQQFSTPLPIAELAAYALDPLPGERVYEPTAGTGNLLAALPDDVTILATEQDPRRAETLRQQGYPVSVGDALTSPLTGDVVLMNPPWGKFATGRYGQPVALGFAPVDLAERFVAMELRKLPDGARLAAVMPTTVLQSPGFTAWLAANHRLRALVEMPPEAYTTRGTGVGSVLLVVDKGKGGPDGEPVRAAAATWDDALRAIEPLGGDGPLARGGAQLRREEPGARPAAAPAGEPGPVRVPEPGAEPAREPEFPARQPGRTAAGEPRPAPARAGAAERPAPAPAPTDVGGGGPERGPEAPVSGVGGSAAAGGGEPGAGVVAEPDRGAGPYPGGEAERLLGEPGGGVPDAAPVELPRNLSGERFSVADHRELEAAARSPIFAPAPLRSAPGDSPHPRLIVRTRSLAGAALPELTYAPKGRLLADAYARKVISDQQLDYGILPALDVNAKGRGYLAADDVGVGKSLSLDTLVLTPSGWTPMRDIRVGEEVIGADGAPTRVLGVYPQPPRQLYRVTFSDGATVECDDEHLWLTQTTYERNNERRHPHGRVGTVRTLAEIRRTLTAPTRAEKNHRIPMVAPVKLQSRPAPVDPYLLGVLLGDGCLRRGNVSVATGDDWILAEVRRRVPVGVTARPHGVSRYDYDLTTGRTGGRPNPLLTALRSLGVAGKRAHEKAVPADYLWNDVPTRLALLQGLMDTDGFVDRRGTTSVFTTTSAQLAADVVFLVRSLGGVAVVRQKATRRRLAYNVSVSLRGVAPFRLPRKAGRVRAKQKYPPRRYIIGVEPVGLQPAQCIKVAAADGLFVVDGFVVTHNTRIAAGTIAEWAEAGDATRILYVTASEVNVQDVLREFQVYAGGPFPAELVQVRSFKGAKARAQGEIEPLPTSARPTVYIIDRYNLAAFHRALSEVGLDALVGDEAHLYKNIGDSAVGKAWINLQQQVLQRRGKFLYLTATPAVDFADMAPFVGLREWTPDGFEDYVAKVTGTSRQARGGLRELGGEFDRLKDAAAQALADRPGDLHALLEQVGDPARTFNPADKIDRYRSAIARLRKAILDAGGRLDVAEAVGSDAGEIGVTTKGRKGFLRATDAFGARITPAEQEQVMREWAMKGIYDSVDLWRAGVDFTIAEHPLTSEQVSEYQALVGFFREVNDAFLTFARYNQAKRFFTIRHFLQAEAKRRMFDYRLPEAVRLAREALARGEQPVISTISVSEGRDDAGQIPAAINAINAKRLEIDPDTGETVVDEEIPEALVVRGDLLERWRTMRQVPSPVDVILGAFGKDQVAVITGAMPPKVRERMIAEFQSGERPIALISGAGKTGISLHHVVVAPGEAQGRRHLIVTDYEWSAQTFKQELGRVDRSGQLSAPRVTVLSTGAAGEKKFLATIANRMRNLGALSKGSAESASNDKLAEFELGGGLDTHAMRLAYQSLPRPLQDAFLASAWKEYTGVHPVTRETMIENTRGYPEKAELGDFLLDLQFMAPHEADDAFRAFWRERARLIAEQEGEDLAGGRTRSHRGEIVRSSELAKGLTLHEVQDDRGHRYGVLQGLVTDNMDVIQDFLEKTKAGLPIRRYVTFAGQDDRQVAGLEIRPGAIAPLAKRFGQVLGTRLETPDDVWQALNAGDHVPVGLPETGLTLRLRKTGTIQLDGARMKERDAYLKHGAKYSPVGNYFFVTREALPQLLERFPVRQAAPPTEGMSKTEVPPREEPERRPPRPPIQSEQVPPAEALAPAESQGGVFPIEESSVNRVMRRKRGYPTIVRVDAKALADAFERQSGETLPYKPERLAATRARETHNAYPEIDIAAGQVHVNDGRHRVAVAAERGQHLDVAVRSQQAGAELQALLGAAPAVPPAKAVAERPPLGQPVETVPAPVLRPDLEALTREYRTVKDAIEARTPGAGAGGDRTLERRYNRAIEQIAEALGAGGDRLMTHWTVAWGNPGETPPEGKPRVLLDRFGRYDERTQTPPDVERAVRENPGYAVTLSFPDVRPPRERTPDQRQQQTARNIERRAEREAPLYRDEIVAQQRERRGLPPTAPRFEPTPEGEQAVVPGTPPRQTPFERLKAKGAQRPVEETPLFGQEAQAERQRNDEAQGTLFSRAGGQPERDVAYPSEGWIDPTGQPVDLVGEPHEAVARRAFGLDARRAVGEGYVRYYTTPSGDAGVDLDVTQPAAVRNAVRWLRDEQLVGTVSIDAYRHGQLLAAHTVEGYRRAAAAILQHLPEAERPSYAGRSVLEEGQPLFTSARGAGPTGESADDVVRYRRAIDEGAAITGVWPHRLVVADPTGTIPGQAATGDLSLHALATAPHLRQLAGPVAEHFAAIQRELAKYGVGFGRGSFVGFTVDMSHHGATVPRSGGEVAHVLLNPFTLAELTLADVAARAIPAEAAPRQFARYLASTAVHELSHLIVPPHDAAFAGVFTRATARATLPMRQAEEAIAAALEANDGAAWQALVREAGRVRAALHQRTAGPGSGGALSAATGEPERAAGDFAGRPAPRPRPEEDLRVREPERDRAGLEAAGVRQRGPEQGAEPARAPEFGERPGDERAGRALTPADVRILGNRVEVFTPSGVEADAVRRLFDTPPEDLRSAPPVSAKPGLERWVARFADRPTAASEFDRLLPREAPATQSERRTVPQSPVDPDYRPPQTEAEQREVLDKRRLVLALEEAAGIPVRVGKVPPPASRRGVFKVTAEVIRTRTAAAIGTVAHELGHFLDKRGLLDVAGYQDALAAMARRRGLKGDPEVEGRAELIRRYVEDPRALTAEVPGLVERFERTLDREWPEMLGALRDTRRQLETFRRAPLDARLDAMIDRREGTRGLELTSRDYGAWWHRFYAATFDDLDPIRRFQAAAEAKLGGALPAGQAPYLLARLVRGVSGVGNLFIDAGPVDYATLRVRDDVPGLKAILRPVWRERAAFESYLVYRRTKELLESPEGRLQRAGRAMLSALEATPAEIDARIEGLSSPHFLKAAESVHRWNDALLDYVAASGRYDAASIEAIKRLHQEHVPFYRVFEEPGMEQFGRPSAGGPALGNLPSPLKPLKGSERRLVSPLESLVRNAYTLTQIANKNEVGAQMADLAQRVPGLGALMERIPQAMAPTTFELARLREALEAAGVGGDALDEADLGRLATVFTPIRDLSRGVVTIYRDGRPEAYQLDPALYRAMQGLDRFSVPLWLKAFQAASKIFRAGIVLSPSFIIRNLLRDQLTAGIQGKYRPFVDFEHGVAEMLGAGEDYQRWRASGGAIFSSLALDRDHLERTLREVMEGRRKLDFVDPRNPAQMARAYLRAIAEVAEVVESGTRVGAFQRALAEPEAVDTTERDQALRAAFNSREISLDFARRGAVLGAWTQTVAFMNPWLQGADKMVRTGLNHPTKVAAVAASMMLAEVALYLWNRDKRVYQEMPTWQKDIFFVLALNDDTALRLPGPFEYKFLFSSLPRRVIEWADHQNPALLPALGETAFRGFSQNVIPTVLQGYLAWISNSEPLTGRPIVPRRLQDLPPAEQYTARTSETAKAIGQLLDLPPAKIDTFIRAHTGTLGGAALDVADVLKGVTVPGRDTGPAPARGILELPGLRSFFSHHPTLSAASLERFYELRDQALHAQRDLAARRREGRVTPEWLREHAAELAAYPALDATAKQFADWRRLLAQLDAHPRLTAEEKRARRDALLSMMLAVARQRVDGTERLQAAMAGAPR